MAGYGRGCPSIHSACCCCSGRGEQAGEILESVRSGFFCFVCLFIATSLWPFCFASVRVSASFPRVRAHREAPASSEARRYIARRACNYHSGVKSGLIRGGESRADQKDLGEDRTKNVKSCSQLKHRDVNLSESTLMFSGENLIKACVTKMVSEDDLTSVAFPPAVSLFTSSSSSFFFLFF